MNIPRRASAAPRWVAALGLGAVLLMTAAFAPAARADTPGSAAANFTNNTGKTAKGLRITFSEPVDEATVGMDNQLQHFKIRGATVTFSGGAVPIESTEFAGGSVDAPSGTVAIESWTWLKKQQHKLKPLGELQNGCTGDCSPVC